MLPLVSVIIPTYNYAIYICEAIESVLHQSYPSECIEIIVVDDGSTDKTHEVLKPYIDASTIKYFYQKNHGKAHATRVAIYNSCGKYIFNLDADDFYFAGKVEQVVKVFESDLQIVHVATPAKRFDSNTQLIFNYEQLPLQIIGKALDGHWLLKYFLHNNILYGGGSTYAARSSVLKKVDIPPDVDMFIDEFLILAVLTFGKSFFIKESLSVWRGHENNYSSIAKTKEERNLKGMRVLNSAKAVLECLKELNYDKDIVKIYELKYSNLQISSKEAMNDKSVNDIIKYAYKVFFKIKPGLRLMIKYHVINRFLPLPFLFFLKKAFKKQ